MYNEEQLKRIEFLKGRIEELNAEITELERGDSKRNYNFYKKGAKIHKELIRRKFELAISKRVLG